MKTNQKGFALLTLLIPAAIILIGLVAFGYFWYLPRVNENKNANTNQVVNTNVKQNQNQNANLNSNTNSTIVMNGNTNVNANANTNTAVDSSNWHIYSNDKYFFRLRYPSNWILGEDISNNQVREKFYKPNSSDTYFDVLPGGEFDYGLPEGGTVTTATIGGREATRTEWTLTSGGILIHISFKTYPSSWNGDNRLDIQGRQTDLATLNQILSTFQFTDEISVQNNCGTLVSYKNESWASKLDALYKNTFLKSQGVNNSELWAGPLSKGCLLENKGLFIFIPEFFEFGCGRILKYDIAGNKLIETPVKPPTACADKFVKLTNDYVEYSGFEADGGPAKNYQGKYYFEDNTIK